MKCQNKNDCQKTAKTIWKYFIRYIEPVLNEIKNNKFEKKQGDSR